MNKLGKEILKALDRNREKKVSWPNNKGKYLGGVLLSIIVLEVYSVIWSESKDPKDIVKKIRDEITSLKKEGYITTLSPTTSDVLDSLKRYYKKKKDTVGKKQKKSGISIVDIENSLRDVKNFFQNSNAANITDKGIKYLRGEA